MKPIYEFIVEIPKSHIDEVELKGSGIVLKFDTKFNQGEHTNRIGKVIATPAKLATKIQEGYIVLIDKNILTFQVHSDSLINKSKFLLDAEKGHYRVPPNMIYLYKESQNDDWTCPAPYIFIEPIKVEQTKTKGGLIYNEENYKGFKEQYGKVAYLNEDAKSMGLKVGDVVYYKKDREYEFKIDDKVFYHMDNSDVLALLKDYEPELSK